MLGPTPSGIANPSIPPLNATAKDDDDDDDDDGVGLMPFQLDALPMAADNDGVREPIHGGADADADHHRRHQQRGLLDIAMLPTPSCTGSMDSLSSSSGSERQVSFTTFGKRQQQKQPPAHPMLLPVMTSFDQLHSATNNDSDSSSSGGRSGSSSSNHHRHQPQKQRPALIFIENDIESPASAQIMGNGGGNDDEDDDDEHHRHHAVSPQKPLFRNKMTKHLNQTGAVASLNGATAIGKLVATVGGGGPLTAALAASANQQSDSTDEDSGIDNIMRIVTEPLKHVVN